MSTAPTAPAASFNPSSSLVLAGSADPKKTRFVLFTEQWLDLQNYIQLALDLPINQGDFAAKYGDFPADQKSLITGALQAMTNVRNLSSDFGNPDLLKGKLISTPDYFNGTNPPVEIYGHIIWVANQISNVAGTFGYMLDINNLQPLIGPSVPAAQRAANLKMILVGQGGLASSAADMRTKTQALITKLLNFDQKMSDANGQILTYVSSQSSLLQLTSNLIGKANDDIDNNLQPAADKAYKAWRDYTIAAVTTSVGIMILSAGLLWPLAVGLGVGLGVAAAMEKKAYNDLMDQIQQQRDEIRKKTQLKTDLTGLNQKVGDVSPAIGAFLKTLQEIEGVWNTASMNLNYIATNYTDAQLGDLNWLMQALKIGDAAQKWKDIAQSTNEYTSNSLVSYNFSTKYGQKIAA